MPLESLLPLTPLQSLLGFDYLPHRYHGAVELLFAFVCFAAAIALRRRRRIVSSPTFMMLGLGALIDLIAASVVSNPKVASGFGGAAVLLFFWGLVRLLMDAVDRTSKRARRDASNILRDLIGLSLYAAVLVAVLAADFQVNVYSLVASVSVLGVVIGFAVQQTLGDIFSGLALQLQRPFDHGDWVRSGQFLGRVQSIGVRSTTILTRGNERLEIPNSVIAKEVLTNYGAPPVCDEVSIGIVGKYVEYEDSYKSLKEALVHGALAKNLKLKVTWLEAEGLETADEPVGMTHVLVNGTPIRVDGAPDKAGLEERPGVVLRG